MIRAARDMVARNALGRLRVIQVEYAQDWLARPTDNKQADWRTDPSRAGAGGCIGDIGTHAFQLAQFVTGLKTAAVSAELDSFVTGRRVDDNVQVMLRFDDGAKGMLWASQVAVGAENGLRLRVYGEKGGLEWQQEDPNRMHFTEFGQPKQILTRAGAGTSDAGLQVSRLPAGHPEGYLEGFATLYREAAELIRGSMGHTAPTSPPPLPGIADGLLGMRFISACIRSAKDDGRWTTLDDAGRRWTA